MTKLRYLTAITLCLFFQLHFRSLVQLWTHDCGLCGVPEAYVGEKLRPLGNFFNFLQMFLPQDDLSMGAPKVTLGISISPFVA
jgi:hypothetical protein